MGAMVAAAAAAAAASGGDRDRRCRLCRFLMSRPLTCPLIVFPTQPAPHACRMARPGGQRREGREDHLQPAGCSPPPPFPSRVVLAAPAPRTPLALRLPAPLPIPPLFSLFHLLACTSFDFSPSSFSFATASTVRAPPLALLHPTAGRSSLFGRPPGCRVGPRLPPRAPVVKHVAAAAAATAPPLTRTQPSAACPALTRPDGGERRARRATVMAYRRG